MYTLIATVRYMCESRGHRKIKIKIVFTVNCFQKGKMERSERQCDSKGSQFLDI